MFLNDQKLSYFINIMRHVGKKFGIRDPKCILIIHCDYLKKISIKTNVATDEGNSPNET